MMTLCDGPAQGVYAVKRAPLYLRAVVDGEAKDVLDQPDDAPRDGEAVYVYRRMGRAGRVHVNLGRRRGTGFYAIADYEYLPGVDGEALRDNERWQAWVTEQ